MFDPLKMAEIEKMQHTTGAGDETRGREDTRKGERKTREMSKDLVASLDKRIEDVEISMAEYNNNVDALRAEFDTFKEHVTKSLQQLESLSSDIDETKDTFKAAIAILRNEMKEMLMNEFGQLKTNVEKELASCHDSFKQMQTDLNILKQAVANGAGGTSNIVPKKVKVPQPTPFTGKREARAVDDFIWEIQQYFEGIDITDDAKKIKTAQLYLKDTAALWWRRKQKEIEQGTRFITTWADFTKEIKRQFYLENAEYEERIRLRNLKQRGTVKDYISEFLKHLSLKFRISRPKTHLHTLSMAYNIGRKTKSNIVTFKTYHRPSLLPNLYMIVLKHDQSPHKWKPIMQKVGEPDPSTNSEKKTPGNHSN
ncbi:uncharacterized protein LOC110883944 [Helianthus annuus]|uniref:uncharacterized protein LOC110883944 n=1 Tax=Helianthus annuus TaxID=4232 RepID=UPI000B8FE25B|nr:uncharacterized protein LOC110883944 [Helianthus annuus]